ncbi:COMM domain-containing protein 9-like [Lytechinus variegatus]|uniref:COMM domain-containing protein 9-like n=1 Tax=Lytechinus variegatus TaxID=7654 RepID=UPI001BB14E55|nr:COMM domain-containing protein 9-like [Lytechinus variegatus]
MAVVHQNIEFQHLNFLLKASGKEVVQRACEHAFLYHNVISFPIEVIAKMADGLGINVRDAEKLLETLRKVIKHTLYIGCTDAASVHAVFPANFHKNLKELLSRIIGDKLDKWRQIAIENKVSQPKLVDFDWRVDIKTSSDTLARMSVPTCILQLQIEETASNSHLMPGLSTQNVELSKETLDTMLDGLGKIRDQLNSVASRK